MIFGEGGSEGYLMISKVSGNDYKHKVFYKIRLGNKF